jgi:hypothetical protein
VGRRIGFLLLHFISNALVGISVHFFVWSNHCTRFSFDSNKFGISPAVKVLFAFLSLLVSF